MEEARCSRMLVVIYRTARWLESSWQWKLFFSRLFQSFSYSLRFYGRRKETKKNWGCEAVKNPPLSKSINSETNEKKVQTKYNCKCFILYAWMVLLTALLLLGIKIGSLVYFTRSQLCSTESWNKLCMMIWKRRVKKRRLLTSRQHLSIDLQGQKNTTEVLTVAFRHLDIRSPLYEISAAIAC